MALKATVVDNVKIVQNSIFDMGELYKAMFRWFENYEYAFHEVRYDEETTPGGKNVRYYWVAEKKIDAYIKFVIEVNVFIIGMGEVEIERNGLKAKSNKGNIEFRISGYLQKDYNNKWDNLRVFHYIYDKVIAKARIDRYESEFYNESKKLIDEIKAFMNLHHL